LEAELVEAGVELKAELEAGMELEAEFHLSYSQQK
jgi:hypothetical protein